MLLTAYLPNPAGGNSLIKVNIDLTLEKFPPDPPPSNGDPLTVAIFGQPVIVTGNDLIHFEDRGTGEATQRAWVFKDQSTGEPAFAVGPAPGYPMQTIDLTAGNILAGVYDLVLTATKPGVDSATGTLVGAITKN